MLVLSRQKTETICIGEDILVHVVDIRGDKVRLGIDAPIDVEVHRAEVKAAIARTGRGMPPKRVYDRQSLLEALDEAELFLDRLHRGEFVDPAILADVLARLRRARLGVNRIAASNRLKENAERHGT